MALVRMKPPVGVSVGLGADDKLYYIDGQGFANVDSGSVTKLTAEGWVSAAPVAPEAPGNTFPVSATKTLTGMLEILGADGKNAIPDIGVQSAQFGKNIKGIPLAGNITSGSGITTSGQGGNNPTVTYIERDGMRGIRIQTAVGFYAEIGIPAFSKTLPKGQVEALFYVPEGETSKLSTTALYLGDVSPAYTNSFIASIVHSNLGCNQHPGYFTFAPDLPSTPADAARLEWGVLSGTPAFATTTFTAAKFRITPTAGQSATIELFGLWANGSNTLPSVVFTADDGYDSVYNVGIPVLEKYGHKLSMAIIGDSIGKAGYMTTAQLKELVARGHECVVHGPTGGNGNVALNYTTYAEILADVSYHKAFVSSNGLATNGSDEVYVFPQGVYQHARDDTRVMDAIRAAGFKFARLATTNQSAVVMADQKRLPYYLPIIGHTWVSAGTEDANIARIIAKIQEAAASGRSVVLMFHKFTAGAAAAAIELQSSNLELICKAVAELEVAQTAKNATLNALFREMSVG